MMGVFYQVVGDLSSLKRKESQTVSICYLAANNHSFPEFQVSLDRPY